MNKEITAYIDWYMDQFKPYKNGRWCYEDGILMKAVYDMYKATGEKKYYDFVYNFYDRSINEDGTIKEYEVDEYNIDNICSGIGLMMLYRDCKLEKFRKACDLLYTQLKTHPRTSEGSFFHKMIYQDQIWMDGIYMGLVFYSMYGKEFGIEGIKEDIDHQLHTLNNRLYDPERKLYMHAFDEKKQMQWADPETGRSPNCWSRACGWVFMAMADIYEEMHLEICREIFERLTEGLRPWAEEGMLYQVVDVRKEPNYKETSGSAMMAYALMKADKSGLYHDKELGEKVFASILANEFSDGHLHGICRVAGLDNKRRNGSFEYYMSEDISTDEVKGTAPFIMAYAQTL